MLSFQVIVDENGNSKFLDPANKAAYRPLLLAIYKSLTIELTDDGQFKIQTR